MTTEWVVVTTVEERLPLGGEQRSGVRGANDDAGREIHRNGGVHDQRIPLVAESEDFSVEWHGVEHQTISRAITAHLCAR